MDEDKEDLVCSCCGGILYEEDEYELWFPGEDSPTGEPICWECFDELPCNDCRGL